MRKPAVVSRRRKWPIYLGAVAIPLASIWIGLWFLAAGRVERTIAAWREHELRAGRVHACATQAVGGFPLRIEVRCADPRVNFEREVPPLAIRAANLVGLAQVFAPTSLTAQIEGPLTVSQGDQTPQLVANWMAGEASVRGTPGAPEFASIAADRATLDRNSGGVTAALLRAERIELAARLAGGSATADPVLGLSLRLAAAAAPSVHPLVAEPLDADISALLRGLPDLRPRSAAAWLVEVQAHGGSLEITSARVQQGEAIAVSTGVLSLNARGALDGQLQVTIVGIDKILKALDVERLVSEGEIGARLNSLDRFIPGLAQFARKNAAPGIIAGLGAIGQSTTLEGRPAVSVPLRFADGGVSLGPIPVGRVPPLF